MLESLHSAVYRDMHLTTLHSLKNLKEPHINLNCAHAHVRIGQNGRHNDASARKRKEPLSLS